MGYEWLRFRVNSQDSLTPSGQFRFDGMTAGLQPNGTTVPNTGNTFAGFLLGYVRQAQFRQELASWQPRSDIHSFYFQDDWKFSPNLTLNLGVRYSNEGPFSTKYELMSNFDPNATDTVTGLEGRSDSSHRQPEQTRQQQLSTPHWSGLESLEEVGLPRWICYQYGGCEIPPVSRTI